MGRQPIPIFRQGGLDGLCGAYSVVNSLTWMLESGHAHRRVPIRDNGSDLLATLLAGLTKNQIIETIKSGARFPRFKTFVRTGIQYIRDKYGVRMRMEIPFPQDAGSLAELWRRAHGHNTRFGPGSVLIGLEGLHEHWTSVNIVHERSLILSDSSGLMKIGRRRTTISEPSAARPHKIVSREMILLSIVE